MFENVTHMTSLAAPTTDAACKLKVDNRLISCPLFDGIFRIENWSREPTLVIALRDSADFAAAEKVVAFTNAILGATMCICLVVAAVERCIAHGIARSMCVSDAIAAKFYRHEQSKINC